MTIPAQISTAAEARAALAEYRAWRGRPRELFLDGDVEGSLWEAERTLAALDRQSGPGPAVHVVPDEGDPFWIGVPDLPKGRSMWSVRLPGGRYGPPPGAAVSTLARVANTVPVVSALAARAFASADIDAEAGGRTRQVQNLRTEANALVTFAGQLEDVIPTLAEPFLDIWRADLARRSPAGLTPAAPPVKPVQLR